MQYEWTMAKPWKTFASTVWILRTPFAAVEDPNRVEEIDDRFVYDEERVQIIGMAHGRRCSWL
jgi:hypothetical protein